MYFFTLRCQRSWREWLERCWGGCLSYATGHEPKLHNALYLACCVLSRRFGSRMHSPSAACPAGCAVAPWQVVRALSRACWRHDGDERACMEIIVKLSLKVASRARSAASFAASWISRAQSHEANARSLRPAIFWYDVHAKAPNWCDSTGRQESGWSQTVQTAEPWPRIYGLQRATTTTGSIAHVVQCMGN